MLQEVKELEPHYDLKNELLKRQLEEAEKGPFTDGAEVFKKLREKMKKPLPETVAWQKIDNSKN